MEKFHEKQPEQDAELQAREALLDLAKFIESVEGKAGSFVNLNLPANQDESGQLTKELIPKTQFEELKTRMAVLEECRENLLSKKDFKLAEDLILKATIYLSAYETDKKL